MVMELKPIARVCGLTDDEFKTKYFNTSTPVIIEDMSQHWPARWKWTFEYFADTYGDNHVKVYDKTRIVRV